MMNNPKLEAWLKELKENESIRELNNSLDYEWYLESIKDYE